MEKEVIKHNHINSSSNNNSTTTSVRERHIPSGNSLIRGNTETISLPSSQSADFVLQWGNRKRLRCMKIQVKAEDSSSTPIHRTTTVRVDRRVVRADQTAAAVNHHSNGHFNLRQRPISPAQPLTFTQRVLRNSEGTAAMKGQSNGVRGLQSPETAHDKKGNGNHNYYHNNNYNNYDNGNNGGGRTASSETTGHDSKKAGGSSSGSDAMPAVWPPKFVIALTNKEKEEDFMAIKGSKLPQRPKKRAKFIQRTVNLVCPGGWLCDLTLERYEVREKKVSKKRPRGLKAMGNMDSDSE
ncbi:hypothetical protein Dimus_010609 [Dionaea muscipula]